ncbi:hypothetical protein KM043_003260 [Ampulex compressa]|nr:hypothetical protein KM043_003260 [Ampulex compressa]
MLPSRSSGQTSLPLSADSLSFGFEKSPLPIAKGIPSRRNALRSSGQPNREWKGCASEESLRFPAQSRSWIKSRLEQRHSRSYVYSAPLISRTKSLKMKPQTAMFLLFVFLGACITSAFHAQSRCALIGLENGRVRARGRGRIIRFSCYNGFTLVGNRYSTCIRGEWDTPAPVCVNTKCPAPPAPSHALVAPKYDGAILIYVCEPGYSLVGSAEIYCDGSRWNGTAPHCRETKATAPLKCDFEEPDLCQWEQDPTHDFDWRRHNFETPSSHIGTGPTHDHTLGAGNDGHYLYIEASGRIADNVARIISPLYNASLTDAGCFSFWYHMYGMTIGALRVYFQDELDRVPRLAFSKTGNQGNRWIHGIFDLPKAVKSFQIIIEGVRGSNYISDIAIDDVAILQNEECKRDAAETTEVTPGDEDQVELVNAQLSCQGKCTSALTAIATPSDPLSVSNDCECTVDCADYSSCCPDYLEYCASGTTDLTTDIPGWMTIPRETQTPSTSSSTRATPRKATTIKSFTRVNISINPKDDIDPPTVKPSTITSIKTTTSTTTTTTKPTTASKRTSNVTKGTPPVSSTREGKTTRSTPTARTTIATTRASLHDHTDPQVMIQDPEQLHGSGMGFDALGIVELIAGIISIVSALGIVIVYAIRRRRNSKRGANGSALSEDSDVRFLTSDEILDFNLARPSDDD